MDLDALGDNAEKPRYIDTVPRVGYRFVGLSNSRRTCSCRFETEELLDEMLQEVEGERGALPLLAFAASQVSERRCREKKLLLEATVRL